MEVHHSLDTLGGEDLGDSALDELRAHAFVLRMEVSPELEASPGADCCRAGRDIVGACDDDAVCHCSIDLF